MLRLPLTVVLICLCGAVVLSSAEPVGEPIRVVRRRALPIDVIPAERVSMGVADDYKPCVVRLGSGELLTVAFHQHKLEGKQVREDMLLFRSRDEGRTWSEAEPLDLLGREPYFTLLEDGTLFITVHLLEQDVRNELGYTHSYIHRSVDDGKTWQTTRIAAEDLPEAPTTNWILTSRNVFEVDDGTLILGVSAPGGRDFLWRSYDQGRTWDRSLASKFANVDKSKLWWPFHAETVFRQSRTGDLLAVARVDPKMFPALPGTKIPTENDDQFERMVMFKSDDGGAHWKFARTFGDYGEMYPNILELFDGRLLLTFTVRAVHPPLGVQAVFGELATNVFDFDFGRDRLVIDAKTPVGAQSGGGFGNTIQLLDETLLTVYSYRGPDNRTHLESVRWMLPAQ